MTSVLWVLGSYVSTVYMMNKQKTRRAKLLSTFNSRNPDLLSQSKLSWRKHANALNDEAQVKYNIKVID